jgi:hypothetical protein
VEKAIYARFEVVTAVLSKVKINRAVQVFKNYLASKMELLGSFETSVNIYQSTRRNIVLTLIVMVMYIFIP